MKCNRVFDRDGILPAHNVLDQRRNEQVLSCRNLKDLTVYLVCLIPFLNDMNFNTRMIMSFFCNARTVSFKGNLLEHAPFDSKAIQGVLIGKMLIFPLMK